MDIEKLTKGELITAALLISFVTAILVGAVLMFLFEDAPADVIRVSERIISSEEGVSTTATNTDQSGESSFDNKEKTRDEILTLATEAVARITAPSVSPRAGVLLRFGGELSIITTEDDTATRAEGLFQDGVIVDLVETSLTSGDLERLSVADASGPVSPLSVSEHELQAGESLFVVPLSELPQIVTVTVEFVSEELIEVSAGSLPAVSLLMDNTGAVVGVYDAEVGAFRSISTFVAQ